MQTSLVPVASPVGLVAELVVINGKTAGTRHMLQDTVTVVGQSKGCDIRLHVEGVKSVHCIIALGVEGPHLRSFAANDTLVNEVSLSSGLLRHGDRLTLGSCQLEICFDPQIEPSNIGIIEPKGLNERQQRLVDLQAQLHEARATFRQERTEQEAEKAQDIWALLRTRSEIEHQEAAVSTQRQRLLDLRNRFIKRWKKHWSTERAKLIKQTKELDGDRTSFQKECATLEFHKSRFATYRDNEQQNLRKSWEELSGMRETSPGTDPTTRGNGKAATETGRMERSTID